MKLLGISFDGHDQNISYFDGHELRYHKFERSKQVKRYAFDELWQLKYSLRDIGIILEDVDDIAITRMGSNKEDYNHFIDPSKKFVEQDLLGRRVSWISHHYAHSLSVFPIVDRVDVSIVIDGLGDYRTYAVFRGDRCVKHGSLENGSIGWGMRDVGKLVGITGHTDDIAGKVMAFQSHGNIDRGFLSSLSDISMSNNKEAFSYQRWLQYCGDELLAKARVLDWLRTIHCKLQEILIEFFSSVATPDEVIGYTGGVAQNVLWNTALKQKFKNLYVPPHSSDEGLSLGSIEFLRMKHGLPKFELKNFPYSQDDIAPSNPSDATIRAAAQMLADGKVVGWYQGNGEIGPRALGNRSILMDPRIRDGKEIINRIKKRENYRPFGASILREHAAVHFDMINDNDEYMLYVAVAKTDDFPAITHLDKTCRLQTVGDKNPVFRRLLEEFYSITGCPALLNTSMNIAGKPLAAYPDNALDILKKTSIDAVIVGDHIAV